MVVEDDRILQEVRILAAAWKQPRAVTIDVTGGRDELDAAMKSLLAELGMLKS